MTAVAVREWVNLHKPVMEANRDFVGRIDLLVDPDFHVIEKHAQLYWDLPMVDSDVPWAGSKATRPPPHVAEHVFVQVLNEFLDKYVEPSSPRRPFLAGGDI